MDDESDLLDDLARSIADGESINWAELEKLPGGDDVRRIVQHFRIVAGVAEVHRSPDLEELLSPATLGTPRTDLPPRRPPQTDAAGLDPAAAPEPGSLAGRRWGHLQLLRKIGEGAFGEVYHAQDMWLDHPVALKLLKPSVANPDLSVRILHEARKLARVRHPNVISIHGADRHNGQVGFWMDLVQGVTLAEQILAGPLSAGEAVHVGREVCRALAAVHKANILHRDVKAQNVMRASEDGQILLMDFGAGEFIDQVPVNSAVQGTPLYLAPEVLFGGQASVQSDIYALGVLVYYLVSGGFPVSAASVPELIKAHRAGARRPLRDLRPDLPESFIAVVERALDPDPARRFASAGATEAALAEALHPVRAPLEEDDPSRRGTERRWLQTAVLSGVMVAAAAVATEAVGFLACRTFEVVLRIEPDFAAGPVEYFSAGATGLLPFLIFWLAGAAVVGVGAALRPLFRSPVQAIATRWTALTDSLEPGTIGAIVFLFGLAAWVAITWSCWDIFKALDTLRFPPGDSVVDLSVLGAAGRPLHRTHGNYSAYLSFALGVAAWRWFPRLEQRAAHPATVRSLRWATAAVVFIIVAAVIAPRRIIWEDFEIVAFEEQPAFVIGY